MANATAFYAVRVNEPLVVDHFVVAAVIVPWRVRVAAGPNCPNQKAAAKLRPQGRCQDHNNSNSCSVKATRRKEVRSKDSQVKKIREHYSVTKLGYF